MIEMACNLWLERADYRCILTTGVVTEEGLAVLESPLAKEAATRFAGLDLDLGRLITARGNHVHVIRQGLVSFPIQQFQWSGPNLQIIERSAQELSGLVGAAKTLLPRPGCGEGELSWEDVSQALASLPDNIVVVQHR